ncbi:MAG TPA: sugar phosphate nucleotidyltransferase [Kofleriaceae bacterium]|jgi:NDP-sugar pyrophosphorylase family protein
MKEPALVLCGGLGTRLRDAVGDVPKVLAPIAGRPFLDLFVGALHRGGIRRIVLLAGYLADQVESYTRGPLREAYPDVEVQVCVESSPLGTGGAIGNARDLVDGTFLVMNGDTYLELDANALLTAHRNANARATIATVHVDDAGRFGSIAVDAASNITGFREKGVEGPGLVNAGVYVLERSVLDLIPPGRAVSLERETLPAMLATGQRVHAAMLPGTFVDIGTPQSWTAFSAEIAARQGSA